MIALNRVETLVKDVNINSLGNCSKTWL